MKANIIIKDKPVNIELTKAADKALQLLTKPLIAEMELYFSCLVRKKVRFYNDEYSTENIKVNENLAIRFRPVMTKSCNISEMEGDTPQVTDFPIANPKAYIPHWLLIDYRAGEWRGEFGYGK